MASATSVCNDKKKNIKHPTAFVGKSKNSMNYDFA